MNWLFTLGGGPYDGMVKRHPSTSDGPPEQLNVCICPCCGTLTMLRPGDPVEADLIAEGARMVPYRFVDLRGAAVLYEHIDEAADFNEHYGLRGELAVSNGGFRVG